MATDLTAFQPLGSRPTAGADAPAVEEELRALWQSASESGAVARVRVLNLVAVAVGVADAARITAVMAQLPVRHPCRGILLQLEPESATEPLSVRVTAYCRAANGGERAVCSEHIHIEARGGTIRRLSGAVAPLLVPDLPVLLWWPAGVQVAPALLTELEETADRLIVDSVRFSRPARGLARLAASVRSRYHHAAPGDLNWGRLSPWRGMVAQAFDPPRQRSFLPSLSHVALEYAVSHGPGNPAQPLLLLGWLAERLGWRLSSVSRAPDGEPRAELTRADKSPILGSLQGRPHPGAGDGELTAVELRTDRGSKGQARFRFQRDDAGHHARTWTEVDGEVWEDRVTELPSLTELDLLCAELDVLRRDPVYEAGLAIAGAAAQRLG